MLSRAEVSSLADDNHVKNSRAVSLWVEDIGMRALPGLGPLKCGGPNRTGASNVYCSIVVSNQSGIRMHDLNENEEEKHSPSKQENACQTVEFMTIVNVDIDSSTLSFNDYYMNSLQEFVQLHQKQIGFLQNIAKNTKRKKSQPEPLSIDTTS